jgi:hypothetical protein
LIELDDILNDLVDDLDDVLSDLVSDADDATIEDP